jgi:hypothetical protein
VSAPAIALNSAKLDKIRKEKRMESNQETTITTPKIRLSLLHWLQALAILIPASYFVFSHISADETSRTIITSRQADMTRHLETLDVKVDGLGNQINKIDGKLDIVILGLKK